MRINKMKSVKHPALCLDHKEEPERRKLNKQYDVARMKTKLDSLLAP